METLSAYQRMRKANLNENNDFLLQYGLQAPVVESSSVTLAETERKKPQSNKPKKLPKKSVSDVERRVSFRVRLRVQSDYFEDYQSLKDSDDEDEAEQWKNLSQPNRNIARPHRPNTYGSIEGVKVGTWWETRLDCNYDGIHRPTVAGIHQGPDGAYSVALSGGYEDDVDLGDSFTYTGEGGRDLKGTTNNPKNLRTAPQSKDQQLLRGNLALSRNVETGNPVRVIRGYKLNSKFAPERGYRYDGLYKVTKCWEAVGKAGYRVYKFAFLRCDPETAPWHQKKGTHLQTKLKEGNDTEKDALNDSEDFTFSNSTDDVSSHVSKNDGSEHSPGKISLINSDLKLDSPCKVLCDNVGWHGWSAESIIPKIDCLTIQCGDEIEQVCLKNENYLSPSDTCNKLSREELLNCKEPSGNMHEAKRKLFEVNSSIMTEAECKFQDTCSWPGWPEGVFSILDCPSTFNCILSDSESKSQDACGWTGWPEGFSILDCPSTFNCVVKESC